MEKLIIILSLLIASCGFFKKAPDEIDESTTEAPTIVESERDGYYYYNPGGDADLIVSTEDPSLGKNGTTYEKPLECRILEEELKVIINIDDPVYTGIYYTKEGSYTVSLGKYASGNLHLEALKQADFLHVVRVGMTVEPGTFAFVKFVILKTEDNIPLAWFDDVNTNIVVPNYDGSVDLRHYIRNDKIKFNYIARGRPPVEDTTIHGSLLLRAYYNCQDSE